jgi:signal transduction histidine kinase
MAGQQNPLVNPAEKFAPDGSVMVRLWPAASALLFAIIAVIFAFSNMHKSLEATNAMIAQRSAKRDLRIDIEHFLSLFKDIESAVRGYVVTGRNDFLDPYNAALEDIPRLRASLSATLGNEPDDDVDWNEVEKLIDLRIKLARESIELRNQRADPARINKSIEAGNRAMDQLRIEFSRMAAFQDRRLESLNIQVSRLQNRAQRLSWISGAAAILLVIVAAILIMREQRIRRGLEQALVATNNSLERRVDERTRELREAHRALAQYAGAQDLAVEKERRRLSREVHDQIGQVFTAIKLIANSIPKENYPAGQADAMAKALEQGIATTRRVTAALRPPLLDDLGLAAALSYFVEDLVRTTNIATKLEIQHDAMLSQAQKLTLFRIAQEAVTNIIRHADASEISISAAMSDEEYVFRVNDNGKGFTHGEIRPDAAGLVSMRERALLAGGSCNVVTAGTGVTVEVRLPLNTEIATRDDETVAG